jgi:hypothetical protein
MKANVAYSILLLLNAAAFMFFAVKWIVTPVVMATGLGIQLTNADAITDAQAVYGGLEFGAGAFLALCALRRSMTHTGLIAATFMLSGLALARSTGILLAAEHVTGATWQLLITDAIGATLNLVALLFSIRGKKNEAAA